MYVMYVSNKLSLSNKLLILGGYWKFKRSHHVPSFWIYWQWRHLFTLVHDDVAALASNLLKHFMIFFIWCHGIFFWNNYCRPWCCWYTFERFIKMQLSGNCLIWCSSIWKGKLIGYHHHYHLHHHHYHVHHHHQYLDRGVLALEKVNRLVGLRLSDHHTVIVLLILYIPPDHDHHLRYQHHDHHLHRYLFPSNSSLGGFCIPFPFCAAAAKPFSFAFTWSTMIMVVMMILMMITSPSPRRAGFLCVFSSSVTFFSFAVISVPWKVIYPFNLMIMW